MSRSWLAKALRDLRASGENGRKLALEVSRFRRENKIPLSQLGQVHSIDLKTGNYDVLNPSTKTKIAPTRSIKNELGKLASQPSQRGTQSWARRHQRGFEAMRKASMTSWLSQSSTTRALNQVNATQLSGIDKLQAKKIADRAVLRVATRVVAIVSIGLAGYEVYEAYGNYRNGKLTNRDLHFKIAESGGGAAGGMVGAGGGAWIGMQLGAFGGPLAWITVPVGGAVGGFIGGIVGYFGGSQAGTAVAGSWYDSLDKDVQNWVNAWLKETPRPIS